MKKQYPTNAITNELAGASAFFQPQASVPEVIAQSPAVLPYSSVTSGQADQEIRQEANQLTSEPIEKERSTEGKKYTSKLVNDPRDPAVNKVGYYFTRKEMDRLDVLATKLKPILRDRFNVKMTKNEIIRAC